MRRRAATGPLAASADYSLFQCRSPNSPSADGCYSQIVTLQCKTLCPATCFPHSKLDTHRQPPPRPQVLNHRLQQPQAPWLPISTQALPSETRPNRAALVIALVIRDLGFSLCLSDGGHHTFACIVCHPCTLFSLVCNGSLSSWRREQADASVG